MRMREWRKRPADVAALFNPVYCAALLNRVAKGYQSATHEGFPYALAFIALPVILHPTSADLIPATSKTRIHAWLLNTPDIVFGFDARARSVAPFVREAVAFGMQNKLFTYETGGRLSAVDSQALKRWEKRTENVSVSKQAQVLGKLLSQLRDVSTAFSIFGVRP